MPRKPPALSSFAPELKQAWIEAATRQVVITLPSRAAATTLRARLYALRQALLRADDPFYPSTQFAVIRLEPAAGEKWSVVMQPADTSFKKALAEAGISADGPPPLDLDLEPTDDEPQS